jgi:hypothetical protein
MMGIQPRVVVNPVFGGGGFAPPITTSGQVDHSR